MTQQPKQEAEKRFSFPTYKLSTLKAYKVDPRKYIMGTGGFIKKGAGTLLTGSSGMGKSVLAMQLALSVATGTDFLGQIKVHKPCRVLLLEAENDADILKRDILSIVSNLGLSEKLVEENLFIHNAFGVSGDDFVEYLMATVMDIKPELVIVDPYQAYTIGDTNSTQSFDIWAQEVDTFMKTQDFALLLVTHKGKPKKDDMGRQYSAYQQMGTSKQLNWARSSMELNTVGDQYVRYELSFGKNPYATGLMDVNNQIMRQLYIEHSGKIEEPYWKYSEEQVVYTMKKKKEIIEKMIEDYPDMDTKSVLFRLKEAGITTDPSHVNKTRRELAAKPKAKKKK